MWSFRSLMPPRSRWHGIQFDTLRLRLIKLAARIETLKKSVRPHLRSGQTAQVAGLSSGAVAPTSPDISQLQRRHIAKPTKTSSGWPANHHAATT
jgi:uncharacterized protein YktB (UPF0637 family)